MAQNETWLKHDLLDAVKVQYLDGNLFSMDNAGNLIGVTLTRDGEDYSGGGSVSANVIRSDGGTVAVSGALSGKTATVVLPQAAYAVPGVVSIVVKLTASGQVTTIAALVANVYRSSTDTAIDPGTIIPSIQTLISQINTAVASIPADYSALWTKLAPAFSTDASYVAGQYVTYNSGLYRFNTSHSGSWSSSDVTAVNLGGEISDLKSALNEYKNGILYIMPFVPNSYVKRDGTIAYYGNWSRTDYVDVGYCKKLIAKTSAGGDYNCFYNASKEFISYFAVGTTDTEIPVPTNAKYVMFSNTDQGMSNLTVKFITEEQHDISELEDETEALKNALYQYEDGRQKLNLLGKYYDGYYANTDPYGYTGTGTEVVPGTGWAVLVVKVPKGKEIVISGFPKNGGAKSCWLNSSNPSDVHSLAWDSLSNNGTKTCITSWIGLSGYKYGEYQDTINISYAIFDDIYNEIDAIRNTADSANERSSENHAVIELNSVVTDNLIQYNDPESWNASNSFEAYSDYIPFTSGRIYTYAVRKANPISTNLYGRIFIYNENKEELTYTDINKITDEVKARDISTTGCAYLRLRLSTNDSSKKLTKQNIVSSYAIYFGTANVNFSNPDEVYGRYIFTAQSTILKKYYLDEIQRVKNVANSQKAGLSFVFATDIHISNYNQMYKMDIISKCGEFTDFVCLNGDIIDGSTTLPVATVRDILYKSVKSAKTESDEVYCTFGNHDDNFYGVNALGTDYLITGQQFYNITNYGLAKKVVDAEHPYANYYYVDFEKYKIRGIFLNACDVFNDNDEYTGSDATRSSFNFSNRQVLWCRDHALRFNESESGWSVFVISHLNVLADSVVGYMNYYNMTTFSNVLKAFKDGSSYTENDSARGYGNDNVFDFTSQGPHNVLFVMSGHTHYDCANIDNIYGIPCITTNCDWQHQTTDEGVSVQTSNTPMTTRSAPTRSSNNATSESFDIVKIDPIAKEIICTRFGAGNSRTISYD